MASLLDKQERNRRKNSDSSLYSDPDTVWINPRIYSGDLLVHMIIQLLVLSYHSNQHLEKMENSESTDLRQGQQPILLWYANQQLQPPSGYISISHHTWLCFVTSELYYHLLDLKMYGLVPSFMKIWHIVFEQCCLQANTPHQKQLPLQR